MTQDEIMTVEGHDSFYNSLPLELIDKIFSFIDPNVLYEKLIRPYRWDDKWSSIRRAAFQRIFQRRMIIRSHESDNFDPLTMFYSRAQIDLSFHIHSFVVGYHILKNLFNYNMENKNPIIPEEIALVLKYNDKNCYSTVLDQARNFIKVIEILSFDNYYRDLIPNITVQITFDHPMTPEVIAVSNKAVARLGSLGKKITRYLLFMRHPDVPFELKCLYPTLFENIHEVRIWNWALSSSKVQLYMRNFPASLKILDLRGNNLSGLELLVLPPAIEELHVATNGLVSIEGPDYYNSNLRVFDANINAITSIEGIRFPNSLRVLRLAFNHLEQIDQDQLPPDLEILVLSHNSLKNLDSIILPPKLKNLQLRANGIRSFDDGFFLSAEHLQILNVSENNIDDLDELGDLPNSLEEIVLDNNEIDYSNFSNILTKNLTTLSMVSTGLISLDNFEFPDSIKSINFSRNEISQINNISFGSNLHELSLASNTLQEFKPSIHNIKIGDNLKILDLFNNQFQSLDDIEVPETVEVLTIAGMQVVANLVPINQAQINRLPTGLKSLSLCHNFGDRNSLSLDFSCLSNLQILNLERNRFTLIENVKYPPTLDTLNYEHNELTTIPFETFPTNIRRLKFLNNCITNISSLPYFPFIEYFGIDEDETELMKLGMRFGSDENGGDKTTSLLTEIRNDSKLK